jgi:hypothetical protein
MTACCVIRLIKACVSIKDINKIIKNTRGKYIYLN